MPWDSFIDTDLQYELNERVDRIMRGERIGSRTYSSFTRSDGTVIHLLATSTWEPAPDGGELLVITQFQDITDQVETHANLRLLVEHTPVSLHLIDQQGRLLFSEGALLAPESARERMEAARATTMLDAFEDFPEGVELFHRALDGEATFRVMELYGRFYDVHMVPVPGPDGTVRAVAAVSTDATTRELALRELRARSAEQATVEDLGRLALEVPDQQPLLERIAAALTCHLNATAVTIHEVAQDAVDRFQVGAESAGPGCLQLLLQVGGPPEPETLGAEAMVAREPVTHCCASRSACADGDPPEQHQWCGLAVPVGSTERLTAVIAAYRPCEELRDEQSALHRQVVSGGIGAFNEREITFVRSVAGVLGAAAARMRTERDIRYQAMHDGLTGLPNRMFLLDRIAHAIDATQDDGDMAGILFVDLDGFKSVNDSLGHQAGDYLLCSIASRLCGVVRPGDTVARLSGDEFAILCENLTAGRVLAEVADRVIRVVREPISIVDRSVVVGASVGAALSDASITDVDGLLRAADLAMYAAKRQGGGRCRFFDEHLETGLPAPGVRRGRTRAGPDP